MHSTCLCIFIFSSNGTDLVPLDSRGFAPGGCGRAAQCGSPCWTVPWVVGRSWACYFGGLLLGALPQIQPASQIVCLYLQDFCYLGGANQLEILQIGPVEIFSMLNREGSSPTVQTSCSGLWLPDLPGRLGSAPR